MSPTKLCLICGKENDALFCCMKCWVYHGLDEKAEKFAKENKLSRINRSPKQINEYDNYVNGQITNIIRKKKLEWI
jgi:hypothetical protein